MYIIRKAAFTTGALLIYVHEYMLSVVGFAPCSLHVSYVSYSARPTHVTY